MAIVTVDDLKEQLGWTEALGATDNALLSRKIDAAQGHVERMLGYRITARFGGEGQEPIPPALAECVLQLAAWWYENRETVNVGNIVNEVPFGVTAIVREFQDWAF